MSPSKLIALGHLLRSGTLTAREIARRENVQPQSLTRILAELEKAGLIRREKAESDRRQVQIEISESGRELLIQDAKRQDQWLEGVMAEALTAAERDILAVAARLLDRVSGSG